MAKTSCIKPGGPFLRTPDDPSMFMLKGVLTLAHMTLNQTCYGIGGALQLTRQQLVGNFLMRVPPLFFAVARL